MTSNRLGLQHSLSLRLLALAAVFIMLAEFLIYAPSIGRYRKVYFEDKIQSAHLAALALEAAPDQMVGESLEARLLSHAGAYGIVLHLGQERKLMLSDKMPPAIDETLILNQQGFVRLINDAFAVLFRDHNRYLRIIGTSPMDPDITIETVIEEAPLRMRMLDYSKRILGLSIVISLFTTALLYICLQWMMVRPIRMIATSMSAFRNDPENTETTIATSQRLDEIGITINELGRMQQELRNLLRQKSRLANIGAAVAKINHDLRNSLSTAMLISDKLVTSDDPNVRALAPELSKNIDQAVDLCSQTMTYVSDHSPHVAKSLLYVTDLVEEIKSYVRDLSEKPDLILNQVDPMCEIEADETQLRRVLANLCRNAVQAGADQVRIKAPIPIDTHHCAIEVSDNGSGMPAKAIDNLFKPFEASARKGGTGLGLVISRDIMRAHGGDLVLHHSDRNGTTFRLILPSTNEDE